MQKQKEAGPLTRNLENWWTKVARVLSNQKTEFQETKSQKFHIVISNRMTIGCLLPSPSPVVILDTRHITHVIKDRMIGDFNRHNSNLLKTCLWINTNPNPSKPNHYVTVYFKIICKQFLDSLCLIILVIQNFFFFFGKEVWGSVYFFIITVSR